MVVLVEVDGGAPLRHDKFKAWIGGGDESLKMSIDLSVDEGRLR